jgi:hypothetical protein
MMAKLTDKLPEGEQWTYEVKWDGYRALLLKSGDRVRLLSRKENDLTATYPAIEAAGVRHRWLSAGAERRRCAAGRLSRRETASVCRLSKVSDLAAPAGWTPAIPADFPFFL